MSLVTLAAAVGCNLGCTTDRAARQEGAAPAVVVDEDAAPAPVPWAALHAQGTKVSLAGPAPAPAFTDAGVLRDAERVTFASGALTLSALVLRPPAMPRTGSTPEERLPGLVIVPPLDDERALAPFSLDALAAAGGDDGRDFVVIVPTYRGQRGNPGAREAGFHEVDDIKAAARFLASEPDVDVDRLFAFGDGAVAAQLALDPECPFKVVGAVGVTSARALRERDTALDAADRAARAFLPHAYEVDGGVKLVIYGAGALGPVLRARNARVEVRDDAKDPLADFLAVMASALAPPAVAWGRAPPSAAPPASSRSAP